MDIDIIAIIVFVLALSFWTGVLQNKVSTLKERLDKNDRTTDKVPELMISEMKIDIEGLKKQ